MNVLNLPSPLLKDANTSENQQGVQIPSIQKNSENLSVVLEPKGA